MPINQTEMISAAAWGDVTLYTLRNTQGMTVAISDLGATMVNWFAPDRNGNMADVLLGWSTPGAYHHNASYFGSVVGRWANRIRDGQFTLDGVAYQVEQNEGNTHLHGGTGFHHRIWQGQIEGNAVRFSLASPDCDAGFPGNLRAEVRYALSDDGTLTLDYRAECDAATPVNLTSHAYFNLNGCIADIRDHLIQIDADHYLAIDAQFIPAETVAVAGSAFDFRQAARIGSRLALPDAQLTIAAGGFDHCYCLNGVAGQLRQVAQVYDPHSGRELTVATTERGLQFYSGNFLAGVPGRRDYQMHDGFCLEAEAYPNEMNTPNAEQVILRPGQVYRQQTSYRIGLR